MCALDMLGQSMRAGWLGWVLCWGSFALAATTSRAPEDWVNQRIGTAAEGQTFPATGVPFGMTQWTPQTRAGETKCVAPYYAVDGRFQGFRATHFLSGSCTQDYGSMTLMPLSGSLLTDERERASAAAPGSETMTPYRYAVTLARYGIRAEMTGTARCGMLRFRYTKKAASWLLLESNARAGDGSVRIRPEAGEIEIVSPVRRLYAGSGKLAGISGYFVVQLDRPFHVGGTWSGKRLHESSLEQPADHGPAGAYLRLDMKPGDSLQVRVGSSFTSLDEARRNLRQEIPAWDFDAVVAQARAAWHESLSHVSIEGSAEQKRIFYTALYHAFLLPHIFSDADGSYPSFASGKQIATARGFTDYDDFSLWDTFRAEHPLLTILEPARDGDMVRSLIEKGEQGGFLPIYPAWNSYTSEMIGDHAGAVIADAYFKGIHGFDIERAYTLMRRNATQTPGRELYVDGRGRRALDSYLKLGYIPLEDGVPDAFHRNEQVSRTLEYAYDDFLVGRIAKALGRHDDAEMFAKRAQNYRNVIDASVGFARGRHADGSWVEPFDPGKPASWVTEGLPYQFTFFAPQDLPGLIHLLGGREVFVRKLDVLFAKGYYDHGNEPSHHIAYLYDFAGEPWKTQQHVHEILATQYHDRPAGLPGNDDCGQISAWYVLSSLGIYQVTPGVPRFSIGTPAFEGAVLHLPGGKTLEIEAHGTSQGRYYIRGATLNGVALTRPWLDYTEIMAGGMLRFEMSATPDRHWGVVGQP